MDYGQVLSPLQFYCLDLARFIILFWYINKEKEMKEDEKTLFEKTWKFFWL